MYKTSIGKMHFFCILLMLCVGIHAHCSLFVPLPVDNDTIIKQLCPYVIPGNAGNNQTWDFRNLANSAEYEVITSYLNPPDSNLICVQDPRARYYWQVKQDSLLLTGYENAHCKVTFSESELRLKRHINIADTLRSDFNVHGEYGHYLPVHTSGTSCVVPDAGGKILLGNDTITNTIRVHTIRQYNELMGVNNIVEHHWQWYSHDYPYPIVDIIRSVRANSANAMTDTTIYAATWIIVPPTHRNQQNAKRSVINSESADSLLIQVQCVPNPVLDDLHVTYCLTRDANVNIHIYNPIGTKIYSSSTIMQDAGYYSHSISMASCMTGTYVLHIAVEDVVIQKIIIKR